MLRHAAAMLGHGGFGTTMGALAAGVPQVVMPIFTFDQVVNAEHVAAVGAGHRGPDGRGRRWPSACAEVRRAARRPVVRRRGSRAVAAELADLPHPVGCRARMLGPS